MISLIEITNPPIGAGYQICEYNTYVTDLTGSVIEPKEYYIVESPAVVTPEWYSPVTIQQPEVLPISIPATVTMRQARLALFDNELLDLVQSGLESLPEPSRTRSLIEWNHGSTVERYSNLVIQMSNALGLSSEQVDNLFLQAASY